jgi:hypothetical protein
VRRDWAELARRVVLGVATAAGVLLVLAMVLSYSGLRSFYIGCGLPDWMASAYPLCVDLLALVAYVAWLALGGWYPAAVVVVGVLGSASAQGFHTANGGINANVDGWLVLSLAGASAMLCAGLAAHLFVMIIKRALPVDFISAMRGAASTLYLPPSNPYLPPSNLPPVRFERPDLGTWQEPPPAPLRDQLPADPFPDVAKLLVDYDNDLARRNGARNPRDDSDLRIHRPRVETVTAPAPSAASQQTGPCAAGCQHHAGQQVSKSARYRCQNTLAGKKDECAPCLRTREGDRG